MSAALIGAVVAEVVSEVLSLVVGKAKDKLRERGVDIDADETLGKLFASQVQLLELSLRGVVDEFAAAELRGRMKPLGGGYIDFEEVDDISKLSCDRLQGCTRGRGHDGSCALPVEG